MEKSSPDQTIIVFVCVENSCRSQIAEGFAKNLADDSIEVYSAGSNPSGQVNPRAILFMAEQGMDISEQESCGFNDLPVNEFDYLITMGCGDACPAVKAKQRIDWDIPDPKNEPDKLFREIRDDIGVNVIELLSIIHASR